MSLFSSSVRPSEPWEKTVYCCRLARGWVGGKMSPLSEAAHSDPPVSCSGKIDILYFWLKLEHCQEPPQRLAFTFLNSAGSSQICGFIILGVYWEIGEAARQWGRRSTCKDSVHVCLYREWLQGCWLKVPEGTCKEKKKIKMKREFWSLPKVRSLGKRFYNGVEKSIWLKLTGLKINPSKLVRG